MENLSREQLEKQLSETTRRLKIIDMIEERLLKMKIIAERALAEDLTAQEREELSAEIQTVNQQVWMLNHDAVEV